MAKHQFRKYIWIIDRLYRTGGITYKELAKAWENSSLNDDGRPLPKRTFDDYKRAIEETFDLNIISTRVTAIPIALKIRTTSAKITLRAGC